MKKADVLALAKNAHLTLAELRAKEPALAKPLVERLEARSKSEVAARVGTRWPSLLPVLEAIRIPLDPAATTDEAVLGLLRKAVKKDARFEDDKAVGHAIEELAKSVKQARKEPGANLPPDDLGASQPIAFRPELREELDAAKLFELSNALGFDDVLATRFVSELGSVSNVSDARLAELVASAKLSREDARAIGAAALFHHALDERMSLVTAVKARVEEPRDLGRLDADAWLELVRASKDKPPSGVSQEKYAKLLAKKNALLFPSAALAARLSKVNRDRALDANRELDAVRERRPGLPLLSVRSVDELTPTEAAQHAEARRFTNRYRGMKVASVLDDVSRPASDREREVGRRVALVHRFLEDNEGALSRDLTKGGGFVFDAGASSGDRAMVLATLRGYQRVLTVSRDLDDAEVLMAGGYHSALTIARSDPSSIARDTGMSSDAAVSVHARAREIASNLAARVGAAIDVTRGGFRDLPVGNVDLESSLAEIPGYAEFFGPQDYCRCEHCRSILSPAAYFVDLMKFVDDHVSSVFFASRPLHSIALEARRPDLFDLELTCKNTNEPIPYLVIIDEILENAVARSAGYTGSFGDRAAVERRAYRDTLATTVRSFAQPFHLPLEELRTHLKHFDRTLADLADATGASDGAYTRLVLGLSPIELDLVTTANAALADLRRVYGVAFTESSGRIAAVDAQLLLRAMRVSRAELEELVHARFVVGTGPAIEIRAERSSSESIQNDVERVHGLSRESLDRLHRFVRLRRALGWRVGELDLVLPPVLDASAARYVARVARLQVKHSVAVEELVALYGWIPRDPIMRQVPVAGATQSPPPYPRPLSPLARYTVPLFDRLFNPAPGAGYPSATRFLLPALASVRPDEPDPDLSRLLAGTGTTEDELLALVTGLSAPLGIDLASPDDDSKRFALSHENLSLLYRHARLAKLLALSIRDLFGALELTAIGPVGSLDDLEALLEFVVWWRASSVSLDDLRAMLAPPIASADDRAIATAVLDRGRSALAFADTLFAREGGVSEADSRAIVRDNAARLVAIGDGHRLGVGFDFGVPLALPPSVAASEAARLTELLRGYHGRAILLPLLAPATGVSPLRLPAFLAMLGVTLDEDAYFRELAGDPGDALASLVARLRRLALVFRDEAAFTPEMLEVVRARAARFGVADFTAIDLAAVRRFERVRTARERLEPGAIDRLLSSFDSTDGFASSDLSLLAELLACDAGLVESLLRDDLPSSFFEALAALERAIAFARPIGIGGTALARASSRDYDDLASASAAVVAAFRARYTDEAEWQKASEPFSDAMLARRRDGLVAYLVRAEDGRFDEPADLYHYFLLDVELDGCMRTSRVAAAIDSVQLYVHRIRMNLERTGTGDPAPRHVLPSSIPAAEWEWRQNYRVWEANRKVFLYPENYLEPELRDDKTPLFTAFEDDLLSKEVTEQSIVEAYARCLRGFDEVAGLTITGSYHEKDRDAERDVLHLFGVTSDEPPVYYYRRIDDAEFGAYGEERFTRFGAWQKVDVQVPVRTASPVVHKGELYLFWVRYTTKSLHRIHAGESRFIGYEHRAFVEYTRKKVDGTWTTPQKLRLDALPFGGDEYPTSFTEGGVVLDPLVPRFVTPAETLWDIPRFLEFIPLYDDHAHEVAKEDYTLHGFQWDRVFPASGRDLSIRALDFQLWSPVDLARRQIGDRLDADIMPEGVPWIDPAAVLIVWIASLGSFDLKLGLPSRLVWSEASGEARVFHSTESVVPCFDNYTFTSLLLDRARIDHYERPFPLRGARAWRSNVTRYLERAQHDGPILHVPNADVRFDVVNGSPGDVILGVAGEPFYLQENAHEDGQYRLSRLGTGLRSDIADVLSTRGLDALLSTDTQLSLSEPRSGVSIEIGRTFDATRTGTVDFRGAFGVYFREIFFHLPFLVANYLNSQGRYEEAQRWYHFVFDPTASDSDVDRCWRYREFRALEAETLRAQLTDRVGLAEYRKNPFNPHAIARLRLTAYQKAIVMKYVDNLLDWGDDLFRRAFDSLNPEYLREATLKYVVAQEILGRRPAELGDCGEGSEPRTYRRLRDVLDGDSEFLAELETFVAIKETSASSEWMPASKARAEKTTRRVYAKHAELPRVEASTPADIVPIAAGTPGGVPSVSFTEADAAVWIGPTAAVTIDDIHAGHRDPRADWLPDFSLSFVRDVHIAFCVPPNDKLLAYWDRVEDRLYKVRHCLDIEGVPRTLPLFAPPLDPSLLVAARAAGVSLDDVLRSSTGELPPFRFRYLLDKAKGYAATLQGFGNALLGAIEKRDGEELARLRNRHHEHVLALTSEMREHEVAIADESGELIARRREAAEYREQYYANLISAGLNAAEVTQVTAQITASAVKIGETAFQLAAAIMHLVPELGSPFAMKYGGQQVGNSLENWSRVFKITEDAALLVAQIAGQAAGFERRAESWDHQRALAEHELRGIEKEAAAAELRRMIAKRSLELHEKSKAQHDEVLAFYDEKFSNLGLYTHLSRTLQSLHRNAYENALAIAKLAELAYRFERPGDTTVFIGGEWDSGRSGLLSGDRLMMGLQNMERCFLETHERRAEINQSFSVAQIAPRALIDLRETGSCTFALPEFYFDLFYPGHYRRRIRTARLTIPCITGPYTNVSAKLALVRSHLRNAPALGPSRLVEVPPSRTTSVALSTAQGDAGVFELSFRDERYMPFEGAGAVSEWRLELPSSFRPFDYQSINDVILNLSYTAEEDATLRGAVEERNAAIEGTLTHYLASRALTRVFSLRQEFSQAFHRLLESDPGTAITIDVGDRHFPLFLQGRRLTFSGASLVVVADGERELGSFSMSLDGAVAEGFARSDTAFGGLPAQALSLTGDVKDRHTLVVIDSAGLARAASPRLDPEVVRDVLIVVDYRA